MTSQDRFEAWAAEHLPTLYLTKTEQGTYESTATGNFFAAAADRERRRVFKSTDGAFMIDEKWMVNGPVMDMVDITLYGSVESSDPQDDIRDCLKAAGVKVKS